MYSNRRPEWRRPSTLHELQSMLLYTVGQSHRRRQRMDSGSRASHGCRRGTKRWHRLQETIAAASPDMDTGDATVLPLITRK